MACVLEPPHGLGIPRQRLTKCAALSDSALHDDADDDSSIKKDPPDTSNVDGLVSLLESVKEPKACRKEIRTPGNQRDAGDITTDPNGQHLWHCHKHGD